MPIEIVRSDYSLSAVQILDLTGALTGPYATFLLGSLGAEVIKIEAPGGSDIGRLNPPFVCSQGLHFEGPLHEDDVSLTALSRNRNKRSLTLDLKKPEGLDLFMDLVATSDVVIENFKAGTAKRLGIDYQSVRAHNESIIYCTISAFGQDSIHGTGGMDVTIQALSGLMAVTGEAEGPPMRVGIPISDMVAPLFACIGILSALRRRDNGYGGQYVEVSMLDVMTSLVAMEHLDVLQEFGLQTRTGNSLSRMGPFGAYRTQDGYVTIAAPQNSWCLELFTAMGKPELIEDSRFRTHGDRVLNRQELDALIEGWTSTLPSAEVVAELTGRTVPCAEVRSPTAALADPELIARRSVVNVEDRRYGRSIGVAGGVPICFSATPPIVEATRMLGSDTDHVLTSVLGLDVSEVRRLRSSGVI